MTSPVAHGVKPGTSKVADCAADKVWHTQREHCVTGGRALKGNSSLAHNLPTARPAAPIHRESIAVLYETTRHGRFFHPTACRSARLVGRWTYRPLRGSPPTWEAGFGEAETTVRGLRPCGRRAAREVITRCTARLTPDLSVVVTGARAPPIRARHELDDDTPALRRRRGGTGTSSLPRRQGMHRGTRARRDR